MKLLTLGASLLVLALSGCTYNTVFNKPLANTTERANVLSGAYINQLDHTTPVEDKAHIRSQDAEILAIDAATRGTSASAATRAMVAPATPATTTGGAK